MCIISFNAFNSLASMGVGETKQFLDDIFGFKLFSEYNDEVKESDLSKPAVDDPFAAAAALPEAGSDLPFGDATDEDPFA
jgi:hypothetical protein